MRLILVQDLLTRARAEHGGLPGQPRALALSGICAPAIAQVTPQADAKGVRIAVAQAGDPVIWGDPRWLGQMLGNLLDNAVKYSPPGGLVQVRLGLVENAAYLEVADSGRGVAPSHLPHIFERFYRAAAARNRDAEMAGLGLGLAICRGIAEAHGSTITVESPPDQGARLTVRLPCAQVPSAVWGEPRQNSSPVNV